MKDGDGPELTLPEAAVLLGTSVESVRRRIKSGRIVAFHDARGRVRIQASLSPVIEPQSPASGLSEPWDELRTARQGLTSALSGSGELRRELDLAHFHRRQAQQELQGLQAETHGLQEELETARQELQHTRQDLAAMWRVMSSRNQRADGQLSRMTDGNEAFDLPPSRHNLEIERSRIKTQIDRVRDVSKRRRWPWPRAS